MKSLRIAFLASAAMSMVLVVGLLASHASAGGGTATAQIGSATLAVDGDAQVDLRALGVAAPGLGAWSVDIIFDANIVAAVGCQAQNGSVCNPAFSTASARVTGAAASGLVGNTTLATLRFRCVAVGSSQLTLGINVFADATIGGPQPLTTSIQNGTIACTEHQAPPTAEPTVAPPTPGPGSSGASFVVPGATYTGNIAGGGTIELTVNGTGSGISFIKISNFSTLCGLISQISTVDPPVPIQNNHFDHPFLAGQDLIMVSGDFLSNTTIQGTVSITPHDANCAQDPRAFVATRVVPATGGPTSTVLGTSTGPNLPSAGSGSGPAGWSMVNWYIAGLVGAGIAWLIAGLSGAGMALIGRSSGRASEFTRAPAVRRDTVLPDFVSLRPRRTTQRPMADAPARARPAPRSEAPRPARRADVANPNGIPSFVSLRRRPRD